MKPFNPNEQILALDFDGVIGNSVHECLLVSYNAYYHQGNGIVKRSIDELEPVLISSFTRMRNYIRSGADFMYILQSLQEGIEINKQADFDQFAAEHAQHHDRYFTEFYTVRETLSTLDFDLWLELNPFYKGMGEYLAGFPLKERLYIITTKKIAYVKKLLAYHKIELVDENLFTADKKRGKRLVLEDIVEKHQTQVEKVWYIDDQVDTLQKIIASGVNCLLARWGYNNDEQLAIAEDAGIATLTLDEFSKQFNYAG